MENSLTAIDPELVLDDDKGAFINAARSHKPYFVWKKRNAIPTITAAAVETLSNSNQQIGMDLHFHYRNNLKVLQRRISAYPKI